MATRRFDIDTTILTSTQPNAVDAVDDNDIPNYGQVKTEFTKRSAFLDLSTSDTTITDVKAIAAADRANNQIVAITGQVLYQYDLDSTSLGDNDLVLVPDDNSTGRWLKIQTGGAGGSGAGRSAEDIENQCELEHFNIQTDGFDNAVCASFSDNDSDFEGFLLEDYTAGTNLPFAVNPKFLDESNKDSLFEAGYSVVTGTQASNINTEGATVKLGASATSFDKASGSVNAFIQHDITTGINLSAHRTMLVFVNLPSITNLSSVSCRFTDEADNPTNFKQIDVTQDIDGNSLAVGWQLLKFDLDAAGTDTGTGWEPENDLLRTFSIGVVTTNSTQTYTNIVFDSLCWVPDDGDNVYPTYQDFIQVGDELTIADASNRSTLIIDSASSDVIGNVTLDAAIGTAYSGGTSSTVRRNTLKVDGEKRAEFNDDTALTSGNVVLTQEVRKKKVLAEAITGGDFEITASFDTPLFFAVTDGAATATTVEVRDSSDYSGELKNGDTLHVIEVIQNDGKRSYVNRATDVTLTADATHSAGITTLTMSAGDVTNVSTSDMLIKAGQLELFFSLVDKTVNESYGSALTVSKVLVDDVGTPYPGRDQIFGHWKLGGLNATDAQKNLVGPGPDISLAGTLTIDNAFKNGQFGAGPFSDANYYQIPYPSSEPVDPDSTRTSGGLVSMGMWVYVQPSGLSTPKNIMARNNGGAGDNAGIHFQINASEQILLIINASNTRLTSASLNLGEWNFISAVFHDNTKTKLGVNGVIQTDAASQNIAPINNQLYIGRYNAAGSPFSEGQIADLTIWSGYELTDADHQRLYNAGAHRNLGPRAGFKYRAEKTSVSGQKLGVKANLIRETSAIEPFITKVGAIKTN